MSVSHARRRRGAAAVASVSLLAAGLAATAPGASAVSGSISYHCSYEGPGEFDLPVILDTNAPARMAVGQTVQLTATSSAVLPGDEAKAAYDTGARSLDGSLIARAAFGTAAAAIVQTIPRTSLGDQAVAQPVTLTAASAAFSYTAPSTPGAHPPNGPRGPNQGRGCQEKLQAPATGKRNTTRSLSAGMRMVISDAGAGAPSRCGS